MSPFEIFLDARMALCNAPEWLDVDARRKYPQTVHLAHLSLERAQIHLGIRALEGYAGQQSVTEQLMETLA